MIAASSSASSSASALSSAAASASCFLHRRKLLWRSPSLPQIRIARTPQSLRSISASTYARSTAERQREKTGGFYHHYSRSHSSTSRAGEAAGALAAPGTLYDVLGLSAGANAQEIKAAFRRLARERHPDVAAAGRKRASAEEFMRIHAAYSTLSDPDKRAEYDRRMLSSASRRRPSFSSSSASYAASDYYHPPPASFNSSSSSGIPRRTWETDQCW